MSCGWVHGFEPPGTRPAFRHQAGHQALSLPLSTRPAFRHQAYLQTPGRASGTRPSGTRPASRHQAGLQAPGRPSGTRPAFRHQACLLAPGLLSDTRPSDTRPAFRHQACLWHQACLHTRPSGTRLDLTSCMLLRSFWNCSCCTVCCKQHRQARRAWRCASRAASDLKPLNEPSLWTPCARVGASPVCVWVCVRVSVWVRAYKCELA